MSKLRNKGFMICEVKAKAKALKHFKVEAVYSNLITQGCLYLSGHKSISNFLFIRLDREIRRNKPYSSQRYDGIFLIADLKMR